MGRTLTCTLSRTDNSKNNCSTLLNFAEQLYPIYNKGKYNKPKSRILNFINEIYFKF